MHPADAKLLKYVREMLGTNPEATCKDDVGKFAIAYCRALIAMIDRNGWADPNYPARHLGQIGGLTKSKAKSAAARANGRKGGRPPKPKD